MTDAGVSRDSASRDAGVTLVELVIAVVVSVTVMGVIAATLITSLGVADSASGVVADSTDESLISGYLIRDAQAAAGTDPATAAAAGDVGIVVPAGGAGWGSCAQSGVMVVRFDWVDRSASGVTPTTVTWALDQQGQLVRRACADGSSVDVVLGRRLSSAVASCRPDPACGGTPTSLMLSVRGGDAQVPTEYTLTASLRGEVQTTPGTSSAAPVPLLVLGERTSSATCPVLSLTSTGSLSVRGGAVVSSSCGAAPVSGDLTRLRTTGAFESYVDVRDPFASLTPPATGCRTGSGLVPGRSTGADSLTVHTAAVTLTGAVRFEAGRHVFCGGLTVAAGADVTGTGVLWYVPTGGLRIESGAHVDLAPATSGPYANLLVWSADASPVAVTTGTTVNDLRGLVYAPRARVAISTALAVHLGGVVAAEQAYSGSGVVRIGLPIPTFAVAPAALTTGQAGVGYSATVTVGGGTSPIGFGATGLPSGLTMEPGGRISGTPTTSGSFTVVVTGVDATDAWFRVELPFTVRPALAVGAPASLASGTTGTAYPNTTFSATGGLAPYVWSAAGLPAGMTMNTSGVVSGTPSAAGSFGVTVTVADAGGGVATRAYTLTVAQAATGTDPLAPTRQFQVLTEGSATLGAFETQGAAAVGGDLVFKNWQPLASRGTSTLVVHDKGLPAGLVVGGSIALATSGSGNQLTVGQGFLHVGRLGDAVATTWGTNVHLALPGVNDNWSTPRVVVSADQSDQSRFPVVAPGAFDIPAAFSQLRSTSRTLASLDPSTCSSLARPRVTTAYGNHTLELVPGRVNVWNITLADVQAMMNVSGPTNPSRNTPLVVNVTDSGAITLPARYWEPLKNGDQSAILWNFPNASAVNVSSVFYGSLVAPDAAVAIDNVTFQGDLVARTATVSSGSFVLARWTTPVPCLTAPPSVTGPTTIADGQVGIGSSTTMTAAGGSPPYRWSGAGVPPGLSMSSDGTLRGTPTTAGLYTVTATVTDSVGSSSSRSYTFSVRAAPSISSPTSLPSGQVGVASSGATFGATGGLAPYTWSASNLHDGLTVSSGGVLSGTPTVNGTRTVTVTVRDAAGATATRDYSLTVSGAACPSIVNWRAELFDNATLSAPTAVCRDDSVVSFSWGTGAPATGVRADGFSARWSRTQWFSAGTYRFEVAASDGFRLFVDGRQVLDAWRSPSAGSASTTSVSTSGSVSIDLTAGNHSVVLEYVDLAGTASVNLAWRRSMPSGCPSPDPDKWIFEIYDGISLSGSPAECDDESDLDEDWGSGGPNSTVGGDTFSVRATRTFTLSVGTYRLVAGSNDGARVYVNGSLVINDWREDVYRTNTRSLTLPAGNHTFVMEFFENVGTARMTLQLFDPSGEDISD